MAITVENTTALRTVLETSLRAIFDDVTLDSMTPVDELKRRAKECMAFLILHNTFNRMMEPTDISVVEIDRVTERLNWLGEQIGFTL